MMADRNTMPRRVSVLGATGSVGCQTVGLLAEAEGIAVEALTANRNAVLLAEQARRLGARLAVVADPDAYPSLREELAGSGIEAAAGRDAVIEAASRPADWVMAAIVGVAGLEPTLASVRHGGVVALANKECLVSAGDLFMAEVQRSGTTLLPVDSEHCAIFQVFDSERAIAARRLILTASGGPFWRFNMEEMALVTPEQAVAHPNWDMGAKISVDSASMMNKGLELIEAHHLFGMPDERLDVLVHPQSVIHGLVEYTDGSVLAQMAAPDMRIPIAYALGWPDRHGIDIAPLDLARMCDLTFETPDEDRFPCLRLAREALRTGGSAPTVLNAANEVAVRQFLNGSLPFLDIPRLVERTMSALAGKAGQNLAEVLEIDTKARDFAGREIAALAAAP